MNIYKKKLSVEDEFTSWIKRSDSIVQEKYTSVLGNIETAYLDNKRIAVNRIYLNEAIFQGSEIMSFAYTMQNRIKSYFPPC